MDIEGIVEHFFRHEYGRILGRLVRLLGREHFELAEESVQEALVKALRAWPLRGLPDDPAAWLLAVAKNHALDACRRSARFRERLPDLTRVPESSTDDAVEMMFLCCHPALDRPDQVALTLHAVGGFGAAEIARAFFLPETTLAQRLVRAKKRIADTPFPPPASDSLPAVLDVLYLMFNEGYTFRDGEELLREDIVNEAIRLASLLPDEPAVHALSALMQFQASRLAARLDGKGAAVPLEEQDRSRWDSARIQAGLRHLDRARGSEITEFHLLAGIASCHATDRDWARIVSFYDELVARNPSFILRLNRAVAVSLHEGPAAGLRLLDEFDVGNYRLATARADCYRRLGRKEEARNEYARAAALCTNGPERRYLERMSNPATDPTRSSPGCT